MFGDILIRNRRRRTYQESMNPNDSNPEDLRPVMNLLRANRPEATALELDAVKQRVRRRSAGAPAGRRARSANLMKSRLAILSMLVAGMLLSTTGAGLAVTSLAGNDASVAQYGPGGGDEGANGGGGGNNPNSGGDNGGVLGQSAQGTEVQPARQVETGAGSGQLPFTGFLAIPVLLGGVVLLSAGIVLRRRTASERR
jgi:hypothetical protein